MELIWRACTVAYKNHGQVFPPIRYLTYYSLCLLELTQLFKQEVDIFNINLDFLLPLLGAATAAPTLFSFRLPVCNARYIYIYIYIYIK